MYITLQLLLKMQDLKSKLNFNKGSVEVELTRVEAKKLTTEERNNLPDSEFAYIKPGGKKGRWQD